MGFGFDSSMRACDSLDDMATSDDDAAKGGGDQGNPLARIRAQTTPLTASIEQLVQRFRLQVTKGNDSGKSIVSREDRVIVGSDDSCELALTDPTVSRYHAEIEVRDHKALIHDMGSRNGTFVDGVEVLHGVLRDGASLSLGRTKLQFNLGEVEAAIQLADTNRFGTMVGESPAMRRVFSVLERSVETDSTVLLMGETGTGKEAAAESIHQMSRRREGPFIAVDCGALPPELIESELFGHEAGAFTGAVGERDGAFQAASGGTLFLDEIGELRSDLQPKLLRVLEQRAVRKVGGNNYVDVDVRVVAATNRDLRKQINEGSFRSDLFYRLAVIEVRLPPLRERREDIPGLVDSLVDRLDYRPTDTRLVHEPAFIAELQRHSWPGNVRELRNYIERCLAMQEPLKIADGDDTDEQIVVDINKPFREARDAFVDKFTRAYLEQLIEKQGGNIAKASRAAGLNRQYFYRLLWRHGLR